MRRRSCGAARMRSMALRRSRTRKPDPAIDSESIRDVVRKTDANPQLVATARFLRRLIPGGEPQTSEMPEPMQRLVEEVQPNGPSTLREIGKGALQAWQALSEAQGRRQGTADVAILFQTPLGLSDVGLKAGHRAEGGEVLISKSVRDELDGRRFKFGPARELAAPGAPADLTVCSVKSRRKR